MTDPNEQRPSFEQHPTGDPRPGGGPSFDKQPPAGPPPGQQPYYGPSPGQPPYAPPPGQPYFGPPPGQPYGFPPAPAAPPGGRPAPGGLYLDPSGVYLPGGTQLASTGRRIGAYFLAIPLAVVTLGIGYVIWGLILWGKGTTPALRVLGMKCWNVNDRSVPGFWRMALREVVGRLVDGILSIITGLISLVLFLTSEKRQSLHDLVAGTTVIHDPDKVLG
jgi:uncharacterized RDD family membrane protein YckC